MILRSQVRVLFIPLLFFLSVSAATGQSQMHFDCTSADAMMKVLLALHQHAAAATVDPLLEEALKFEAYRVSHERYTDPERSKENQVTLAEFRRFMRSFSGDRVDTRNNRRLVITKPLYDEAIANPDKFQKALETIRSVASSRFQDSFNLALSWLPTTPQLDIHVWVLFDIGGSGAWAFRTQDGKQNVGFNILHLLDDQGEFDVELFAGTLAHEIHHLGSPLGGYFKAIRYENLDPASRLKLYSDYFEPMIAEGIAMKFCNNAPGVLSPKPNPEREFAANRLNLEEWAEFQEQFAEIHRRAVKDLRKILGSPEIDREELKSDYDNYWTWRAGQKEGKTYTLGREYYYGTELLGVINMALGREAVLACLLDLRKVPALYNEGVKKIRPQEFDQYLFPEDIVKMIQELSAS
jgi:hypothetical protein